VKPKVKAKVPVDRVAVLRCDGVDLSALADSGFVDLAADVADVGVDLDVAAAGFFLTLDDGSCWLAVGVTFVAVLADPAAGFWPLSALLDFVAVSAGFAAGVVLVFSALGLGLATSEVSLT